MLCFKCLESVIVEFRIYDFVDRYGFDDFFKDDRECDRERLFFDFEPWICISMSIELTPLELIVL